MPETLRYISTRVVRAVTVRRLDGTTVMLQPNEPSGLGDGDAIYAILQAPDAVRVSSKVRLSVGCQVTWETSQGIQGPGVVWQLATCQGAEWALVVFRERGCLIKTEAIIDIQPYPILQSITEACIDCQTDPVINQEKWAIATGLLRHLLIDTRTALQGSTR